MTPINGNDSSMGGVGHESRRSVEETTALLLETEAEEAMNTHDPRGSGWNLPPPVTPACAPELEMLLFTGENFPEVNEFLGGRGYRLDARTMLVDDEDRVFLLRRNDVVVRWPNGRFSRHRP